MIAEGLGENTPEYTEPDAIQYRMGKRWYETEFGLADSLFLFGAHYDIRWLRDGKWTTRKADQP
jgi:hypothetical protein